MSLNQRLLWLRLIESLRLLLVKHRALSSMNGNFHIKGCFMDIRIETSSSETINIAFTNADSYQQISNGM